jgi:tetraacyldisaccharide 4'-kinase
VLAFAGIGRPAKFFATLREAGADVADAVAFPDHHRFTARELEMLMARARRLDAVPVTTAKDAVRLPGTLRDAVLVADVTLDWEVPSAIEAVLDEAARVSYQLPAARATVWLLWIASSLRSSQ